MPLPEVFTAIEEQEWTEQASEALDTAVGKVLDRPSPAARQVKNFLHGSFLGHPLHVAVTDVPVGAWTTAAALDLIDTARGRDDFAQASDAAVAVGLAGAVLSAASGLADWHHTSGHPRRVGLVHALFNAGATVLYTGSLVARKQGARGTGKFLGLLGYAAVFTGAYLGGHLSHEDRIGVDHAASENPPEQFTAVLPEAELREGELRRVEANGTPVLLARQNGQIYALVEKCAHMGGPLSEGELNDGCVICPWHGSTFALQDGSVVEGPSAFRQPSLVTRVRNGQIEVRASE